MDKKSKIIVAVLLVVMVLSIGYSFWKTVIKQDSEIVNTEPATDADASLGDIEVSI